ncbi:MAG: hypothetical protein AB8B53_09985 [Flavobacteriales bacterium]
MKQNVLLILLLSIIYAGCKTEGCTYEEALNYEADAELDDGSCVFPELTSEEEDPTSSSAADVWVGNFIVNETSQVGSFPASEDTYSISITAINENRVLIQNLMGCGDMEANVAENSMVVVEFDDMCSWQLLIIQTDDGFDFTAQKDDFGMVADVAGTAVRQ